MLSLSLALALATTPSNATADTPVSHAGNSPVSSPSLQHDLQHWTIFTLQGKLAGKFNGYLEIQPRFALEAGTLDRVLIRPAAVLNLNSEVSLWVGYAGVQQLQAAPAFEHRFWQQIAQKKKFGGVIIVNRARLEQRFLPGTVDVQHRLRQMLRAIIPIDNKKLWAVVVADELFFNLNGIERFSQAGFEQNRFFAGVSRSITERLRAEAGYLNVFLSKTASEPDRMHHVGSFLLQYSF